MIQQFQLTLNALEGVRIPQAWAYRLYGWLMSQISSEFGDQMHLQGEHPIAHSLYFSQEKRASFWTINLLNDVARQVISPVLESAKDIPLHELTLSVSEIRTFPAISAEELICSGRSGIIEGTAYTLIAYSKALRCKVRLVIWQMPNGKKKLFFSTDVFCSSTCPPTVGVFLRIYKMES